MDAREELLGIAQLAVALIGFSGLISVFRSRGREELQARDLSALAMIMSAGSLALVFALLPLPLRLLGLDDARVWTISTAAFAAAFAVVAVVFFVANRRLNAAGHRERTPVMNRFSQLYTVASAVGLTLSAADLGLPRGPGVYVGALIGCLLACLLYVAVLLVLSRTSPR
jgi:hypothetical protein